MRGLFFVSACGAHDVLLVEIEGALHKGEVVSIFYHFSPFFVKERAGVVSCFIRQHESKVVRNFLYIVRGGIEDVNVRYHE
jgi:hypothetical protein